LFGGTYFALRSASVQTRLTRVIASYLSAQLKTRVEIRSVNIAFFNNIILEGLYVEDLHRDTLIYADRLKVGIKKIDLKNHHLQFDGVSLQNLSFYLKEYCGEEDINLQFLLDAFSSKDTTATPPGPKWTIDCNSFELEHSRFAYQNQHIDEAENGLDVTNLLVSAIDLHFAHVQLSGDTISGLVKNLSCIDKSGFRLQEFSGMASISPVKLLIHNLHIKTPSSNIYTELEYNYSRFGDFLDFENKVKMNYVFSPSNVNFKDIAYFAHDLIGMDFLLGVTGEVHGAVNNMKGKNLALLFGNDTKFKGNVSISGLPDIDETFLHVDVDELITTRNDINKIPLPPFEKHEHLEVPPNIAYLGKIKFKGSYTGFFSSFVAYGNFNTDLGRISSDISIKKDEEHHTMKYNGQITSSDFDIGKFIDKGDIVGKLTLDAHIDGRGFKKTELNATLEGLVKSVELNQYNYKNIDVKGNFTNRIFAGSLNVKEENIDLNFSGTVDFSNALPQFNFVSDINKANLSKLNLVKNRNNATISSQVMFRFTGDNLDNAIGNIVLQNANYTEDTNSFHISHLDFSIGENRQSKWLKT